jgi:hypothetical protein
MSKYLAILVVLAACGADVPANPTYFADVQPILRANCARCHGADPSDSKIAKYRLDRYVKNDTQTLDAFDYAQAIHDHAVDHMAPAMPPDYELTTRQMDILAAWVASGAPKGTRDNHLGQIVLIAPTGGTETADQTIDTTFRSWDDDLDGLAVQLWARDAADGQRIQLGAQTGGGQRTLSIDSGTLAHKHTFAIYAVIDDGFSDDPAVNKTNEVTLIPSVYIDHGLKGTAPTVQLLTPNDGGTQIGTVNITWNATDPDVDLNGTPDALTIDLSLVRYDANDVEVSSTPITTTSLPNMPSSFAWTIPSSIPTMDGATPIPYRIRVTATDTYGMPRNVRSDVSDLPFTIQASTTTTYTWTDSPAPGGVGALFDKYCKQCHSQPPSTPVLDPFCFIEYDQQHIVTPCEATDLGVYEKRADVYNRVVTLANMPPATANVKMTTADRAVIANWLAGGAPYGAGPSDPRPTFVWDAPTKNSGTTPIMLTWHAADGEGLTMGAIQVFEVSGGAPCNFSGTNACCSGKTPTTTHPAMTIADPKASATLAGAMSWMDSFSYTPPTLTTGFHCVQGVVTDTSGQTTTVVNAYGLK